MNFNPTVTPDDILMSSANGHGPRVCIHCLRAVGHWHRPSCIVTKERYALAERKPKPARYRYAGLGLLLALALTGCETHYREVPVEQSDPRTEADWPRLCSTGEAESLLMVALLEAADSLTVTNSTPWHLLLEQGDRVTLAQPDSSYTLPAGAITIREAREYDE